MGRSLPALVGRDAEEILVHSKPSCFAHGPCFPFKSLIPWLFITSPCQALGVAGLQQQDLATVVDCIVVSIMWVSFSSS